MSSNSNVNKMDEYLEDDEIIWSDKKRILGLPISFTRYTITENKLVIKTGIFVDREEEILLYRIKDVTLRRGPFQQILGVGTISIESVDITTPKLNVINIKNSRKVKELLSKLVDQNKRNSGVSFGEILM